MDADIQEHKRVLKEIHAEKRVLHLLIKQAELLLSIVIFSVMWRKGN